MPYITLDETLAEVAPAWTVGAPRTSYGKTLADMTAELQAQLGGRTDIDPARMAVWINDAYLDLASSLNLPELRASLALTILASQPLYMLPDNFDHSLSAALVDTTSYAYQGGTPLDKIDDLMYRRLPDLSDLPRVYFVFNNMLVLWPTPSQGTSVVLECEAEPMPLVNDTDSPILARAWHEGVQLLAKAKAHAGLLEPDLAQLAMNDYIAWMRRRQDKNAQEKDGMIARARGVRSLRDANRLRPRRNDW